MSVSKLRLYEVVLGRTIMVLATSESRASETALLNESEEASLSVATKPIIVGITEVCSLESVPKSWRKRQAYVQVAPPISDENEQLEDSTCEEMLNPLMWDKYYAK